MPVYEFECRSGHRSERLLSSGSGQRSCKCDKCGKRARLVVSSFAYVPDRSGPESMSAAQVDERMEEKRRQEAAFASGKPLVYKPGKTKWDAPDIDHAVRMGSGTKPKDLDTTAGLAVGRGPTPEAERRKRMVDEMVGMVVAEADKLRARGVRGPKVTVRRRKK